jgi:hypothetical protein
VQVTVADTLARGRVILEILIGLIEQHAVEVRRIEAIALGYEGLKGHQALQGVQDTHEVVAWIPIESGHIVIFCGPVRDEVGIPNLPRRIIRNNVQDHGKKRSSSRSAS